jgi:peptide deformylase
MTLPIAQLGQPVLRRIAEPIPLEDIPTPTVQRLIDDMLATLHAAKGAGLAGPQVFASRRIFLAAVLPPADPDGPPGVEVFINPTLLAGGPDKHASWEGCLSFPELLVLVPRFRRVSVEYLDRQGQARVLALEDFAARVVQHEYDHLQGILTIDRAPSTRYIVKASEIEAVVEEMKRTASEGEPR